MEKQITFQSQNLNIEGLIDIQDSKEKAVVITHPHPQMGGDMYNNVVESIALSYHRKGYTTLRFNFRGAGNSQGNYNNGIGEQEDVHCALKYLSKMGIEKIDLAGYSFGTWINALLMQKPVEVNIKKLVMVAPPVAFLDFSSIIKIPHLQLIITGSHDEFAPPKLINQMMSDWNPQARLKIIQGADHFSYGIGDDINSCISELI